MTTPTNTSDHRRTTKMVATLGLITGLGIGAVAHGAGTALAPEPAKLSTSLSSSTGATAAAILVTSHVPTKVVAYSSSFMTSASGPAAGTPCSSSAMAIDATTHVIQVYVSSGYTYRR